MTDLELTREDLEEMSQDDLVRIARGLKRHEEVLAYAKGDIYLENAHEDQIAFHKADNRVRIFFGGNRCLAEGTQVATPAGPKAIEDIAVGDQVYDECGQPIRVLATWANGIREVADVTNRGRTIAVCTEDHVWLTSTWRSRPKELPSSKLGRDVGIERRQLNCPLGSVFEPHAYVLGALIGNGCSRQNARSKLYISSPDHRVPQRIAEILGAEATKCPSRNFTWKISVGSCHHYDAWVRGRYSHEKTVDLAVAKRWDRDSLVRFVAGVLDTDGSVFRTKDRVAVTFALQAKDVIGALQYACLALWQIDFVVSVDNRDKYKRGPVYNLTCQNITHTRRMLKELDPHLVTPSKKWKPEYATSFGRRTRATAVSASWGKNRRKALTYDLTVASQTNLYCLANGLVTHNSGKTTAGTNEMRWLVEGTHPHRPFRTPIKACIVCQDFQTHANDIILPKLREWFPPGLIVRTEKNQSGTDVKFFLRNGSTLDIKSHDQDIKVFEGSDYDVIWFDEPPPQAIFKALWRGLTDRRGIAFITGTPITEPWLYDLYQKAQAEDNKGLYWSIFSEIHKNAKNLGEGDVEEGKRRIAEFLDALDPDEREAREKGRFLHMKGLIFKTWNRGVHLIPPFKWPARWPIYISVDPHPRKPWAVSFNGVSTGGYKFLIHSAKVEGVVEDVAEHILRVREEIELDQPGLPLVHSCWIDNYASVESMIKKNTTIIEELNSYVSPTIPKFRPAPKNVEEKITLMKGWLKVKDTKYGPRPGFMVFDTHENKEFVREIEHYVWASQRGANRNQLKNVPVKENDDILDTVMQLALVLDSKRGQDAVKERPQVIKYAGR